ncbi:MAG: hypothetical protein ACRBF0_10080 [Calditrichia bacterium]
MPISNEIAARIIVDIEDLLDKSSSALLALAANQWSEVTNARDPITSKNNRDNEFLLDITVGAVSTGNRVNKILKKVIRRVTKEVVGKNRDISTITFTYITFELIQYLETNLEWEFQPEYILPLKLLVVLIYRSALKEINSSIK